MNTQIFMKEGISSPLTTTGAFCRWAPPHLPEHTTRELQNTRAEQCSCQFQAFFTMLCAWHGPASSFSGTCRTRNRIRSVVMAELSGWEQGAVGSVMKILGISKATPPCLQLWCSHYLLAVSLTAMPSGFLSPPAPYSLCVSTTQVKITTQVQ